MIWNIMLLAEPVLEALDHGAVPLDQWGVIIKSAIVVPLKMRKRGHEGSIFIYFMENKRHLHNNDV